MKLKSLRIKNFLSYKDTYYEFVDGTTPIVGVNKTDDKQGSNGAGKTGLSQAIYYALVGSSLRSSIDRKLITKGENESTIQLDIYCSVRKQLLSIVRKIYLKGSSKLELTINGKSQGIATVNDGNRFILQWIAISAEDIKSYFIICKEYYKSFYKTSNTDRLALISRFINFDFLDQAKPFIQEKIKKLEETLAIQNRDLNVSQGKMYSYEQTLEELQNRDYNELKRQKIEELQQKIDTIHKAIDTAKDKKQAYESQLLSKKDEISSYQETLKDLHERIDKIPSIQKYKEDIKSINEEIGTTKEERLSIKKQYDESQKELTSIERELSKIEAILSSSVIECPKCHHQFLLGINQSIDEKKKESVDFSLQKNKILKKNKRYEKNIEEIDQMIEDLFSLKENSESEIQKILNTKHSLQDEIDRVDQILNKYSSSMKNIQNSLIMIDDQIENNIALIESYNNKINEITNSATEEGEDLVLKKKIQEKIQQEKMLINQYQSDIDKIKETISCKNEWIVNFKDFKMFLALEQIKNIEELVNHLLEKEDSDLRLLIEAYKKDSRGNLKEEITPLIVRDDAESFWYYSGGERAKVEIATILAIQQMINLTNPWGGLEFLCIDEITEGLSQEALISVVKAFDEYHFPILLITHVLDCDYLKENNTKVLKIVKENGISRIEL